MAVSRNSDSSSHPLLSDHDSPDYVVVLPPYPPPHRHVLLRKSCRRCLFCFALLLVGFVAAGYILWPYNPELSIVRLRLDRLQFHNESQVSIDVTLELRVKVWNPAVYSLNYDSLVVAIGYGGERLGFVNSDGGVVMARDASYVNATLRLDRVEISSDVVELIKELEKGEVTLDAISEISGKLGIFSLQMPLKVTLVLLICNSIVPTHPLLLINFRNVQLSFFPINTTICRVRVL